jgi:hypothetical protein
MAGTKGAPRFSQALLAEHVEGLIALSGCRDGELARRLRVGDREGARRVAEGYATLFQRTAATTGRTSSGAAAAGFVLELQHHLLPEDDWLVAETAGRSRPSPTCVVRTASRTSSRRPTCEPCRRPIPLRPRPTRAPPGPGWRAWPMPARSLPAARSTSASSAIGFRASTSPPARPPSASLPSSATRAFASAITRSRRRSSTSSPTSWR